MKVIIQLQYSLADSRVFHDVKNITQSSLHPTQPNPTHQKLKKNSDPTQPNPWMDPTDDQLWSNYYTITKPTSRLWTGSSHDFVVINFMAHIRCISRGFRFLKSFGGGRDVQKGHFRFVFSFTKYNMAAKRIYLSEKRKRSILAG